MTKNEFIQKTIIAIAGNTKYWEFDREHNMTICGAAKQLANTAEHEGYVTFDDDITPTP